MANQNDMARYMQAQREAIADDKSFPLNDFNNRVKVGNVPTGKERQDFEQSVLSEASQLLKSGALDRGSVIGESSGASERLKREAFARQKMYADIMRKNNAKRHAQTSGPRPPSTKEELQARQQSATQQFGNIVTKEEESLIMQGQGELGRVDAGRGPIHDNGEYDPVDKNHGVPASTSPQLPFGNDDDDDGEYEPMSAPSNY